MERRESPQEVQYEDDDVVYTPAHLMSIVKPVSLTMLISACIIIYFEPPASALSTYLVYTENNSDSAGEKFWGSILNTLIIVGVVLCATIILVLLYKYRCIKIIVAWLCLASASLLGLSGAGLIIQITSVMGVLMDWISLAIFLWNFAIVGVVTIFWKGPIIVKQGYLVAVSCIMTWVITKLPEWTAWTLVVGLALYDICAVLTPCGPLKALVEMSQERGDPIPGLLYEARPDEYRGHHEEDTSSRRPLAPNGPLPVSHDAHGSILHDQPSVNYSLEQERYYEEEEDRSVKLGLGDFVFYSVLVSRAAMFGFSTAIVCFLAILAGLGLTLYLLTVYRKALPALPFSILLGTIFYFVTRIFIVPYFLRLGSSSVYI